MTFVNGVKFQKGELAQRARNTLRDCEHEYSDIDDK